MAQHDYILANQSGAAFRSDLNNGLAAIVSNNSGVAQPSTTYAYQWWSDTTTGLLKLRNAANNAWITIGTLADANLGLLSLAGGTLTGALLADDSGTAALPAIAFDGDPNTGIFRPAADQLGIATNGVERVEFGTTEVVFNDGGADVDFRVEGDTNASLFKIDAGLDQVQVANLNGGPLAGTRNRIINGNFDIAQRGTSFAAIANAAYSLDRWTWGQAGAMVCTVTQSTDVPNNTFQSSYKVDVTTVDSSIAAGDYAFISQKIEGYNVRDLIGTTFTVSFWVKSPKTGVHCVSFSNSGQNRSYIKEYTIAVVNTWEYKTVTVTGGLITAGTWNWTNGEGLEVGFSLATGSTYQTTSDAWQTGDFLGTANQVNVMDNTANDFFLTGVQLEPGPVATPFERRPIGTELALCQRYFHISSVYGWGDAAAAGNTRIGTSYFKVEMRTTPTVVFTTGSGSNVSGQNTENVTSAMFGVFTSAIAAGPMYIDLTYTASAEL
jgi:hypothetical protein